MLKNTQCIDHDAEINYAAKNTNRGGVEAGIGREERSANTEIEIERGPKTENHGKNLQKLAAAIDQ